MIDSTARKIIPWNLEITIVHISCYIWGWVCLQSHKSTCTASEEMMTTLNCPPDSRGHLWRSLFGGSLWKPKGSPMNGAMSLWNSNRSFFCTNPFFRDDIPIHKAHIPNNLELSFILWDELLFFLQFMGSWHTSFVQGPDPKHLGCVCLPPPAVHRGAWHCGPRSGWGWGHRSFQLPADPSEILCGFSWTLLQAEDHDVQDTV